MVQEFVRRNYTKRKFLHIGRFFIDKHETNSIDLVLVCIKRTRRVNVTENYPYMYIKENLTSFKTEKKTFMHISTIYCSSMEAFWSSSSLERRTYVGIFFDGYVDFFLKDFLFTSRMRKIEFWTSD